MYKRDMELSDKMEQSLTRLGVVTLYLFGSRAQGIARSHSDYDFGVLLKDPVLLKEGSQKLYQSLYELLQEVVHERVNVDIVFLDQAPLQLRYHVVQYGQVLLDEDPRKRGFFIERTLEEHADFEPYRRLFEETTLARLS